LGSDSGRNRHLSALRGTENILRRKLGLQNGKGSSEYDEDAQHGRAGSVRDRPDSRTKETTYVCKECE
jgi:hypothetical protein